MRQHSEFQVISGCESLPASTLRVELHSDVNPGRAYLGVLLFSSVGEECCKKLRHETHVQADCSKLRVKLTMLVQADKYYSPAGRVPLQR